MCPIEGGDLPQERKNLAFTLKDTKSVVAHVEMMLGVILHMLFAFAYLYIFEVDISKAWVTFSSCLLAFVFVFGNNIRSIYEVGFLLLLY